MENKLDKKAKILISMCDSEGQMSVPALFSLFMDLASEHGTMIRLGSEELAEKGLIWLTVKTKIRINRRPAMMEEYMAETWPEKPGRVRCNRFYRLRCGDEICAEGKTEWAMFCPETGKLGTIDEVYPQELVHYEEVICEGAYARIGEDFADAEVLDTYRVRSTDIDVAHHMNNALYIRAFFGALSCEELAKLTIREVDVVFRSPSFEGEVLTICRRRTEEGFEIGILHADGKAAAVARVLC